MKLDVYFDVSSPYSYLGTVRVTALAKELGVTPNWKPVLIGGVFNASNKDLYSRRQGVRDNGRIDLVFKDWMDWAEAVGIRIIPAESWPVNSVKAMRGCCLYEHDPAKMMKFAYAAYDAHWGQGLDISKDEVLRDVCAVAGVDHQEFVEGIAQQSVKDRLRTVGEELISRRGYGVPTFYVDDDVMFFGQDHVPLLRRKMLEKLGRNPNAASLDLVETP